MKTFLIIIGSIFGLLMLALFGFVLWIGVSIEAGNMPDTMVLRGRELKPSTVKTIEKLVPLRPGEKIEYFYSGGFWSFEEDGNIITNQRVISYSTDNGVFWSDEVDLEDIESIEAEFSDTWLEDSFVWINPKDGDGFCIILSCEEKVDREAVNHLRGRGIAIGPVEAEAVASP